jgi:hypothetical protein
MSAIFFPADLDIGRGTISQVRIDVTPAINKLLGVKSAPTVQGSSSKPEEPIVKQSGVTQVYE